MKVLEHRFGYGLTVGILLLCAFGAIGSLQFRAVSTWFPLFVGVTGALLAAVVLIVDLRADHKGVRTHQGYDPIDTIEMETGVVAAQDVPDVDQPPRQVLLSFLRYLAWFVGFATLFILFGLPLSVFVWLLLFVRFGAKESWLRAVLGAVIMTGLLFVLAATLALALPEGVLLDSSAIIPAWRF